MSALKTGAGSPSRECPRPSMLGISPLFSSFGRQRQDGVYISLAPAVIPMSQLISTAIIYPSGTFEAEKPPLHSVVFGPHILISIEKKVCPGGRIVLKHRPHRLHLPPAHPIARTKLAIIRPFPLVRGSGPSLRIARPTEEANDNAAIRGRSNSRTRQICRHPLTTIERPMVLRFRSVQGQKASNDGGGCPEGRVIERLVTQTHAFV